MSPALAHNTCPRTKNDEKWATNSARIATTTAARRGDTLTTLRGLALEDLEGLAGAEEGADEVGVDHGGEVCEGRVLEGQRRAGHASVLRAIIA